VALDRAGWDKRWIDDILCALAYPSPPHVDAQHRFAKGREWTAHFNESPYPTMSHTQAATQSNSPPATLDPGEVERFQRMADDWWNPNGQFKPLHALTPARIGYLRDTMKGHFGREGQTDRPLAGLRVLDIGCGGGLVAEPLTRLGAQVTGIDPGSDTIATARAHAQSQGLVIDYRVTTIEQIAASGETFDCVTCLEVVEHVFDVGAFLASAAQAVRPGGLLIVSTLNRTLKSYGLAIIGAEYILGWLPRGTHDWNRFVTPDEMAIYLKRAGLGVPKFTGLVLDPLRDEWRLSGDTGVNYFAASGKT
jgi:2-polyprenyl-6-hydroxyphenyl methylase / 3-demethylubiquinone-9 3-methyltransferase